MENFKYMSLRIGGDVYGATVHRIGPEKDVLYIMKLNGHIIRVKKNRRNGGYGEQVQNNLGRWEYKDTSKYRHLSTWYPSETEVPTYFNPSF